MKHLTLRLKSKPTLKVPLGSYFEAAETVQKDFLEEALHFPHSSVLTTFDYIN